MQTLPLTVREIAAWLRLMSVQGLKFSIMCDLLAAFGLPEAIFDASHAALTKVLGSALARRLQDTSVEKHRARAQAIFAWACAPQHHWVTLSDPAYPAALYCLADPPTALYVKGQLQFLHRPAIAIVGSRHASVQGLVHAEQFAQALAARGVTVISGLALGIDGAAHRGALADVQYAAGHLGEEEQDAQRHNGTQRLGSTVAVLGTGIDHLYPTRHRKLAQAISEHGALISEYPLGAPACAYHFPKRNRLIAALSEAVLVVEAAAQSGSLITARLAGELGREVLAIPGSIHSPVSKGCHQLIKEGAKLVESIADIMEELKGPVYAGCPIKSPCLESPAVLMSPTTSPTDRVQAIPSVTALLDTEYAGDSEQCDMGAIKARQDLESSMLNEHARTVLNALGYDPVALSVLAERTHLTSATLQATLLELELEGWVSPLPGGRIMRIHANSAYERDRNAV